MGIILDMVQRYGAILRIGLPGITAVIMLMLMVGILRQIKQLNRSIRSITDNMQAYFDVILTEEGEQMETVEESAEDKQIPIEEIQKKEEEERIFNAVLQEYFS